jgi:glycopeptide antibiotics resistance protein
MIHLVENKKLKGILFRSSLIIFLLYIVLMIYLLFFGFYRQKVTVEDYNIIPFRTIAMYMNHGYHFRITTIFNNLFGNILAFMPLGFFIQLLFFRRKAILTILLLSFLISLCVEFTQYYFQIGGFDVDDILLNTIGGIAGSIMLLLILSFTKRRSP